MRIALFVTLVLLSPPASNRAIVYATQTAPSPNPLAADVDRLATEINPQVVAWRRDFHQHPELSWKEKRTQAAILDRLHALGLDDVRAIATTGATALVRGSAPGKTVLWRADIDALPIP